MAVSPEDLIAIDTLLAAAGVGPSAFAELRRRLPHLSWTRCDAADVTETPFRVYEAFELHLLDAAEHCVTVTGDPARATGIVLAQRKAAP